MGGCDSVYKCIRGFKLEKWDDDEHVIDGEYIDVKEGSIWVCEIKRYSHSPMLKLQGDECWIEIHWTDLVNWFIEMSHFGGGIDG